MQQDYRRFCLNREIFPRHQPLNTKSLICGHLNRLKFPPNVQTYLDSRAMGVTMKKSCARARRCFCRQEQKINDNQLMSQIQAGFVQGREFIQKLQNIDITKTRPKEKSERLFQTPK